MPPRQDIFDLIIDDKDPAADRALLKALPEVDLATEQKIIKTLLTRKNSIGLCGLVEAFHLFNETSQRIVGGEIDRLYGALREASQLRIEQTWLNVVELIRRGSAYRASYLLAGALHDRSARVREAAAEALYALADKLLETSSIGITEDEISALSPEELNLRMADLESRAEDRRQVISAIDAGLTSFNVHLHPHIVESAMWFVDDFGTKFWSLVSAPGSRTARAAISIFKRSNSPRLIPFAIMALNHKEFRGHVVKELSKCTDPVLLAELIRQSWRISQVKTAKGISSLKELACVRDCSAILLQLPLDSQCRVPRWIIASGVPDRVKIEVLRDLYRLGDREVRRSAVWGLIELWEERSTSLLQVIARDNDPEFSTIARHELAHRRPGEYQLWTLAAMQRPAYSFGDGQLNQPEKVMTFNDYWSRFDQLSNSEQKQLGQELLARSPMIQPLLKRQLMGTDASDRMRAIRMVTILGMAKEFEEQLCQLAHDTNSELRSTAMSALGQVRTPTSKRILNNALIDQDIRVQANAVEAMENSGDDSVAKKLLPMLASADNRVRANAVKALLKLGVREAAETLLLMLEDDNRAQRISALWLIERMGLGLLAKNVIKLADSDEDMQVRHRAKALADDLLDRTSRPADNPDKNIEVVPLSR